MLKRTYLIGMLAAGPGLLSCAAAADEILLPVQMSFFHTGTAREARPVPGDEDTFLSLLRDNIASGGPPKDGIPAIDRPQYTSAPEADRWLLPEDIVFGVNYKGLVAAYPQRILVWHEIANESVGGGKISIALGLLVAANVAVSYFSFRALGLHGVRGLHSLIGTIPALVSGAACCVPTLILVIGLQLTATLATVWSWLVPASALLLAGSLWWSLHRMPQQS